MSPRGLSNEDRSLAFVEVFPKELEIIRSARGKRQAPETALPLDKDLIGLAFSGGGIRSATFNLGVIQALAKYRLLHLVDYLSTVSGGGYIGSWLSSWAYYLALLPTANKNHIGLIEEILNRKPKNVGDLAEPPQIHFLRKYSNYLTPRLGILSGDTLAFVATYIRNLLLNQTIFSLGYIQCSSRLVDGESEEENRVGKRIPAILLALLAERIDRKHNRRPQGDLSFGWRAL